MSGLLCLASAAVDVGNCLSILGEILDMCRLAKAGAMIRTAGIAYTTGTMAYLTGESMANTITLYIDNDYQITDEVAESAGLTVMSGLGTVMGYRALDGSIRQMQSLEAMGTYCFAAGTLVLTEDGFRNIEDIEPGDKVYSTDEETGESGYKEVLQVFVKETEVVTHVFYEVEQEDGETRTEEIETTLNHLFWCEGEWKAAGTLKAGDLLTLADGSRVEVTDITYEDRHTTVYNMEVADYHTYYVGEDGVWVHNTDRCTTLGTENISFADMMSSEEAARYEAYWKQGAGSYQNVNGKEMIVGRGGNINTRQRLQVSPGTRSIFDVKYGSNGEMYYRETIFDEYGRRIGNNDFTNHGMPNVLGHTNPHFHLNSPLLPDMHGDPLPGLHPNTPQF